MAKPKEPLLLTGLMGILVVLLFMAVTVPVVMASGKSESDSGWIWTREGRKLPDDVW